MASTPPTTAVAQPAAEAGHAATPLPVNDRELAILSRVLGAASFDGVEALRAQLRMLQVHPASDGTFRIYLLHPDAPRSSYSRAGRSKLPDDAPVWMPEVGMIGKIEIWVEHGRLRGLHYVSSIGRAQMALPDPAWVVISTPLPEPAVAAPFAAAAAAPARTRVRAPKAPQSEQMRTVMRRFTMLCAVLAIYAAFSYGASGGANLDAARADGRIAGAAAGERDGILAGTFQGSLEGAMAGQAVIDERAAAAEAAAADRRAAAAKRRADRAAATAAAAATPRNTDNTTCSGYRDGRGYWICS